TPSTRRPDREDVDRSPLGVSPASNPSAENIAGEVQRLSAVGDWPPEAANPPRTCQVQTTRLLLLLRSLLLRALLLGSLLLGHSRITSLRVFQARRVQLSLGPSSAASCRPFRSRPSMATASTGHEAVIVPNGITRTRDL